VKINMLEKKILDKFFSDKDIHLSQDLSVITSVNEREYTGVGFFTWFNKDKYLKVGKNCERAWEKLGAKINNGIETGYIVYVEDGYINCIEGYTYSEKWPEQITNIEFYWL